MKVSDYVAQFLVKQGVHHAFVLSGGACMHLIDSIDRTEGIEHVCCLHEQANAMAADAYARVTGFGCAISTSGPGATNMLTGIAGAYDDSVPVLYITGQQVSTRLRGDLKVRQIGFQETDIVAMARPITKKAVQLKHPDQIRHTLEMLTEIAKADRPGPVLLDIPDDFQRAEIDLASLMGYGDPLNNISPKRRSEVSVKTAQLVLDAIRTSERPIFIPGYGCRLAAAADLVLKVAERFNLPICPTWAMVDAIPHDQPLLVGRFGTHGLRGPNFAVANADLILAVGTRLDSHASGNDFSSFARGARKIAVDIDPAELEKFGDQAEGIVADAGDFLRAVLAEDGQGHTLWGTVKARREWTHQVSGWKDRYALAPAVILPGQVDPIAVFKALSRHASGDATIVLDTGCTLAWFMQAFEPKPGQRIHHDYNNTAMGWALPAAIGASIALGNKPVICVCGDGGLLMNIQELATVAAMNLPIHIICLNNKGQAMTRQTQKQWFGGRHPATGTGGGLPTPGLMQTAHSFGIPALSVNKPPPLDKGSALTWLLNGQGPRFLEIHIPPEATVAPQLRFGRPIEDAEPLLPRDEFLAQMIVEPAAVSR